MSIYDVAAIVGLGETEFTKRGGINNRSEFELCLEAIKKAAIDAGCKLEDIDGFCSFGYERHEPVMVQQALDIPQLRFSNIVWGAGGGGCSGSVMNAVLAIKSGICKNVIVYRSIAQGQYERYGQYRSRPSGGAFMAPFGLMSPAQMVALTTQRYKYLYGLTTKQLGMVAVTARAHANRNPRAVMYSKLLNLEQHEKSKMIADPFRLFDCCLETDGACALLVTSKERAKDAPSPVRILAAAQCSGKGWGLGPMGSHNMPVDDYASTNSKDLRKVLFSMAGLNPSDIDVAQIYDAFTGVVIMALEDFGFCEPGTAGQFVMSGELAWPDGSLPFNTAGGLLSEGYLHGLNLVSEGVRQMRGDSTSQVSAAETCFVSSGGAAAHKSALILAKW